MWTGQYYEIYICTFKACFSHIIIIDMVEIIFVSSFHAFSYAYAYSLFVVLNSFKRYFEHVFIPVSKTNVGKWTWEIIQFAYLYTKENHVYYYYA